MLKIHCKHVLSDPNVQTSVQNNNTPIENAQNSIKTCIVRYKCTNSCLKQQFPDRKCSNSVEKMYSPIEIINLPYITTIPRYKCSNSRAKQQSSDRNAQTPVNVRGIVGLRMRLKTTPVKVGKQQRLSAKSFIT
jgi:hypothetical protein